MQINFHIDQITEIMKYLDEVPHKYARGLVEYIQNHVTNQIQLQKNEQNQPTSNKEIVGNEADKIKVQFVPADEPVA